MLVAVFFDATWIQKKTVNIHSCMKASANMNITLRIQKGPHKQDCDDAALIEHDVYGEGIHQIPLEMPCTVSVADGVGGNQGGKHASHFVLHFLGEETNSEDQNADALNALLQDCNAALLSEAEKNPEHGKMATTLTAAVLRPEHSLLLQAGNTRLYGMPGSYLKQVSEDQTTYQMLMNMGRMVEAEACNKSEIVGCLGGGNPEFAKRAVVQEIPERMMRNLLLLTSDGIHEYVKPEIMEDALECGDDAKAAQKIIDAANAAGSDDDKTVMIVRF